MKPYEKHGLKIPEILKNFVHEISVGKALDIGCAGGAVSFYLSSLGYDCTGIDIELPEVCKKDESIRFLEQDISDFEFQNNYYNLIAAFNVLHSFSRTKKYLLLDSILNSLSCYGYLFVTSFTINDGGYIAKKKLKFKEFELNTLYDYVKKQTSSYFSENELKNWAISKKLDIVFYEEKIVEDNHAPLGVHQHGIVNLICKK